MDSFEIQDQAVADHFSLTYKSQNVPIIFASPDRVLAQIKRLYPGYTGDRPRLPVVSLWRQEPAPAPDRFRYNSRFPLYVPEAGTSVVVDKKSPLPVDIPYQLEIWGHSRKCMNLLTQQVAAKFTSDLTYITAIFSEDPQVPLEGWGEKTISCQLQSMGDNSDLEYGEEDTKYRFTFSLSLRGWFFGEDYEEMKNVLAVQSTYHDLDGDYAYDHWDTDEDGAVKNQDPPPYVGSITPSTGPVTGGTAVTITGGFFADLSLGVVFDSDPATSVVIVNEFTITCLTPAHSEGASDILVTNDNGFGTLPGGFTFIP